MTVIWRSDEATAAVTGMTTRDWSASGVSIDSRTVGEGDLFVAIRGPNTDGHLYVGDALARGAAAAMVARDWAQNQPAAAMPLLIVENTDEGLNALGRAARDRGKARIVAITGSVGKTSTKEALAQVLSRQAATSATAGRSSRPSTLRRWGRGGRQSRASPSPTASRICSPSCPRVIPRSTPRTRARSSPDRGAD